MCKTEINNNKNCIEDSMIDIRYFSEVRSYHFQLIDGLDLLLCDPKIESHIEFPLQIESLRRSGAFIVLHASENYHKFGRRLLDVNEDLLVLTSYIVRHLYLNED